MAGHCEPNALLKVMLDMFSDKATSSIFYTTDLMVLIDIIHRQLSDMEAGSKVRVGGASFEGRGGASREMGGAS